MTTTNQPPVRDDAPPAPPLDIGALLPPPQLRKELRKIHGLTQGQAAAPLGVSDSSFSLWEKRQPSIRHMRAYLLCLLRWADDARAMGIPIAWPSPPAPANTQK